MDLQKVTKKEVQESFKWRDRHGEYHDIQSMETRHLFYTLRMIWNHTMPLKFVPFRQYSFAPFYTVEYMTDAVRNIVPELWNRKDMTNVQRTTIAEMINYLAHGHITHPTRERLH